MCTDKSPFAVLASIVFTAEIAVSAESNVQRTSSPREWMNVPWYLVIASRNRFKQSNHIAGLEVSNPFIKRGAARNVGVNNRNGDFDLWV